MSEEQFNARGMSKDFLSTLNIEENEKLPYYSNTELESILTNEVKLEEIIKNYDPTSVSEDERKAFYGNGEPVRKLWDEYYNNNSGPSILTLEYNLWLTEEELKLIKNELVHDGTYNVENILLMENFYNSWLQFALIMPKEKVEGMEDHIRCFITIHKLTTLYNLLKSQIDVKGVMNKKFINYCSILRKIGVLSKIYDKFDAKAKGLADKIDACFTFANEFNLPESNKIEEETIIAETF